MAKKSKKCPFCRAEVNKENLNKHFLKVHRDLNERDFKKHGLKKPARTSGKKTQKKGTRESKRGNKVNDNRKNIVIAVIILIVIISLIGVLIYQNLGKNEEPNNGTPNNGTPNNGTPNNGNGGNGKPIAIMTTTLGTIKIELNTDKAPVTAGNFIDLANDGFYDGIIFHRVVSDFMIQGGGFTSDDNQKSTGQVPWENTGLQNSEYSIAMARSGNASSESDSGTATSQFFINVVDNPSLDSYAYPFVVFGRVIEGFSVVDAIEALPTGTHNGMEDWPDDPPVITSIVIEE